MATTFNALPVWEQNRQLDRIAAGGSCGECFVGAIVGPVLLERITQAATTAGATEGLDRPLLVDANFSGVHFTGDAAFERFEFRGGLHARPLTVDGEDQPVIIDGRLHLGGAEIEGYANLSGATIGGNADLSGATIGGNADLSGATIGGDASLSGAKIGGDASLSGAKIGGDGNLYGATIGGNADLSGATIEGDAHLSGAKIEGDAHLSGAKIEGDASLVGAEIGGYASLSGAEIGGYASLARTKIGGYASLGGAKIGGNASLGGATIAGNANLSGAKIEGDASLARATIGGNADLFGATIGGNADLFGAKIEGDANLGEATIGGDAILSGSIGGDANLSKATIGGNTDLVGAEIGGDAKLRETRVGGGLTFDCEVSGGVDATGLSVEGAAPDQHVQLGGKFVLDRARVAKEVRWTLTLGEEGWSTEGLRLGEGGQITVTGGELNLSGATIVGPLEITTTEETESEPLPRLVSVERMDLSAPVTVAPGIDVSDCKFGRTPNLDQLRFAVPAQFHTYWGRQVIRAELDFIDEGAGEARGIAWVGRQLRTRCLAPGGVDEGKARRIAGVYRQLRTSMEAAKDYAGASDFYYGEMEMRRSAAWHTGGVRAIADWVVIWIYWLMSGYGLRAWRAFATFAVVVALATVLFQVGGFSAGKAELGYVDTAVYTLKSSISLLRPPGDDGLNFGENLVQITLRILAPALFALGVFALRARIRR